MRNKPIKKKYKELPGKSEGLVFLYVFRRESDGYTKIGITESPRRRMNEIADTCGSDLRVVCAANFHTREDARSIEAAWHKYFEIMGKRSRGEWFILSSALLHELQTAILLQYLYSFALLYGCKDKHDLSRIFSMGCWREETIIIEKDEDERIISYEVVEGEEYYEHYFPPATTFWLEEQDNFFCKNTKTPIAFIEEDYPVPAILRMIEESTHGSLMKDAAWKIATAHTGFKLRS